MHNNTHVKLVIIDIDIYAYINYNDYNFKEYLRDQYHSVNMVESCAFRYILELLCVNMMTKV